MHQLANLFNKYQGILIDLYLLHDYVRCCDYETNRIESNPIVMMSHFSRFSPPMRKCSGFRRRTKGPCGPCHIPTGTSACSWQCCRCCAMPHCVDSLSLLLPTQTFVHRPAMPSSVCPLWPKRPNTFGTMGKKVSL